MATDFLPRAPTVIRSLVVRVMCAASASAELPEPRLKAVRTSYVTGLPLSLTTRRVRLRFVARPTGSTPRSSAPVTASTSVFVPSTVM